MSEQWQFIVTLNEHLRPLRNPAEIQEAAIRLIGKHLGASRVSFSYVDGDEFVMSRCYADGVFPLTGRGKLALIGTALGVAVFASLFVGDRAPMRAVQLAMLAASVLYLTAAAIVALGRRATGPLGLPGAQAVPCADRAR